MRLPRTPIFDEESVRYDFRFCCEECGHFDADRDQCAHDWPMELHRRVTLGDRRELDFCKEFELC